MAIQRPDGSPPASVSVSLEGNTITANHGYGISYRTKAERKGVSRFNGKLFHFTFPQGVLSMTSNVVTNNGLAFPTSSRPADGEAFIENKRPQPHCFQYSHW